MKKFDKIQFIKKMLKYSPRQLTNENKTCQLILNELKNRKLNHVVQKFTNYVPKAVKVLLRADKRFLPCQSTSFVSGQIISKNNLISSCFGLFNDSSADFGSNINFNPYCRGISAPSYYRQPSLAVKASDINKIIAANNIHGEIVVEKKRYSSFNIIVGNLKHPQNIVFTHYDSLNKGAIDNASGVAVLLSILTKHPLLALNSLFVFAGAEELSYDWPIYWGYGYRIFEEKYKILLRQSKKIIVIDGVGNGKTRGVKDTNWLLAALPLKNLNKLFSKTIMITGDIQSLLAVYHSDLDDIHLIKNYYLNDAEKAILKALFY